MNYPDLDWQFLSGDLHTVSVGFDTGTPVMVMDILLFDTLTATESVELTQEKPACEVDPVGAAQFMQLCSFFVRHKVPAIRKVARRESVAA